MPCDMAVSIARAKLTNSQILEQLSEEDVRTILAAFAQAKGLTLGYTSVTQYGIYTNLGQYRVSVATDGTVDIKTSRYASSPDRGLADEITVLLAEGALAALARKVSNVLGQFGVVETKETEVDNGGLMQTARLLTLRF